MGKVGNSISLNKAERKVLKKLIDRKYNRITTSIDYESTGGLHETGVEGHIYKITGKELSGSTIERMVGLTKDQRNIRLISLEIIAEYLDFKGALQLINCIQHYSTKSSKDIYKFSLDTFIKSHTINIILDNNKVILIRLLEGKRFEILNAKNSKLRKGDKIEINQLEVDEELLCDRVFRNQNQKLCSLGQYKSGNYNKVKSITLTK